MANKKELAVLNADALRGAVKHRRTADVSIMAGKVRVRSWSLAEAEAWDKEHEGATEEDAQIAILEMVAKSWIGADGELLVPVEEGVEIARNMDPSDLRDIATAILKLNGRDVGAVEDAVKNSEASRSESTSTGSPENSDTPA